jgi:hypothetical protein
MPRVLKLADLAALAALGVDTSRYSALPRPQAVAEAAYFVGFDGLMVPNARFDCLNVIVFCDRVPPQALEVVRDRGPIAWDDWRKQPRGY